MNLRQLINQLIDAKLMDGCFVAEIKEVNKDENTCTVDPINGDVPCYGVRLNVNALGFMLYPSVGSAVLVQKIGNSDNNMLVTMVSEVDEIKLLTKEGKITLNGDEFGGMVKYQELKEELNKVKQFIEVINAVLDLQVFEPGNGAPSALQLAFKSALTGYSSPSFENLTNENVQHGGN